MRRKHSNPRILPFPRAQCPDGRSWLPTDARPRKMMGGDDMVTYINKKMGGEMIGYPAFKSEGKKKRKKG